MQVTSSHQALQDFVWAIPYVEKFFTDLFVNLHESLFLKAESVFLRGLAFTVEALFVKWAIMQPLDDRFLLNV